MKLFIFKDELKALNRMLRCGVCPEEYTKYIQAVQLAVKQIMDGDIFKGKKDNQRVELRLTTRQSYCLYEVLGIYVDIDPNELGVTAYELRARMVESEALQPHAGLQLDGTYPSYKNKRPFA